jgi:hypothetical protein
MPDIESCRLYTGGSITNNQVTVMLVSVPSAGDDFSSLDASRYVNGDSLSFTSLYLT